MYEIKYLPSALEDLREIVSYVAAELDNPVAAERLAAKLVTEIQSLQTMPYRRRVYVPIRQLDHEFRALRVGNYLAFYWVDEEPLQEATIARVLYAKEDVAERIGLEIQDRP